MTETKRSSKASKATERLDWNDIKGRVEIAAIATAFWGPAQRRSGHRLLWCCPWHDDHSPSLQVDPARQTWKCWPCDIGGDAAALVMRLKGVGFPEAICIVAEMAGIATPSKAPARPIRSGSTDRPRTPARPSVGPSVQSSVATVAGPPVRTAESPPDRPSGLDRTEAERLVEEASERIWRPEGADALAHLRGRGLTDATIRVARLGWTPGAMLPTSDGARYWRASGIVIPWLDRDRLALVKIRQPDGCRPRYAQAFSDHPAIYPGLGAIRPGAPLVIVEGELDTVLVAQEIGHLASIVTLGSASSHPEGSTYLALLRCPVWYAAHDADEAGDRSASEWPGRAVRVRPPIGKDWTESLQAGIDLRRWWVEEHFPVEFDRQERAAIMEHDGGLSLEDAERAAGLRIRQA